MYKKSLGMTSKEIQALHRKQSDERLKEWQKLTPREQLNDLDKRAMVATRQRKRIQSRIK